jgi:NADH:ubiquinone oxidoreductase subunit 6 (subunit J)
MKTQSPYPKKEKGFVSLILLVLVALVILYYLNIPLSRVLSLPTTQTIASDLRGLFVVLWQDFLLLFQFIKDIVAGK